MVIDKIENALIYQGISKRIGIALNFLVSNDLQKMPLGKHLILGDEIFALVMEYQTKDPSECKMEAHKKYIDIQYMVWGKEAIGMAYLDGQAPVIDYDQEKDVWFFDEPEDLIMLNAGCFSIFFPHDLHRPAINLITPELIRKVVIKVMV